MAQANENTPDYKAYVARTMRARGVPESVIDLFRHRWAKAPPTTHFPCPLCTIAGRQGILERRGSEESRSSMLRCSNRLCMVEVPIP